MSKEALEKARDEIKGWAAKENNKLSYQYRLGMNEIEQVIHDTIRALDNQVARLEQRYGTITPHQIGREATIAKNRHGKVFLNKQKQARRAGQALEQKKARQAARQVAYDEQKKARQVADDERKKAKKVAYNKVLEEAKPYIPAANDALEKLLKVLVDHGYITDYTTIMEDYPRFKITIQGGKEPKERLTKLENNLAIQHDPQSVLIRGDKKSYEFKVTDINVLKVLPAKAHIIKIQLNTKARLSEIQVNLLRFITHPPVTETKSYIPGMFRSTNPAVLTKLIGTLQAYLKNELPAYLQKNPSQADVEVVEMAIRDIFLQAHGKIKFSILRQVIGDTHSKTEDQIKNMENVIFPDVAHSTVPGAG